MGSIIFLEHDDISPADLILLESSEIRDKEAICFIDSQLISGRRELSKKKSSILIHTNFKYSALNKFNLSCKLEYLTPNQNLGSFSGYLKLFNDPKIEKLTTDNFIPQGALIEKVSWIMGLVVYIGKDTKLMRNCNLNFNKTSFLDKIAQIYFLTFFCIVIILSFVIFF